jgi:hypothetical protein
MRLRQVLALLLCAGSIGGMTSAPAFGAPSYCCVAGTLSDPDASDALSALQRAVGSSKRCKPPHCDCDGSGSVTITDAMGILKAGVQKGPCPTTTTTTTLPPQCGNNNVEAGEDCDPPHSFCRGGCNPYTNLCVDLICSDSCTCPPPECGDYIIDAGESCDPPGSACESGTCDSNCGCASMQ